MPRPSVPEKERCKTHSFSYYDGEKKALKALTRALMLHCPFDVVRYLIAKSDHPAIVAAREKGSFRDPRFASKQTLDARRPKKAA